MGFYEDFDSVILSPNHGGPSGVIVALCFHDEEAPETNDQAENVAAFFAKSSTQASTTGTIDNNSMVGCVPYGVTAWHSGAGSPWNGAIEGYEHSGYARQTREEWLDAYGIEMLERSAKHFAKRCHDLNIPPRKVTPAQLREAVMTRDPSKGGICSHKDITDAVPVQYGHYDPGPDFPWDYYISRVNFYYGGNTTEDIMATKEELQAIVDSAKNEILTAVKANKPVDTVWMATHKGEGRVYLVLDGVKYHVPDPAMLPTLEKIGADNRGVQDAVLNVLPTGAWSDVK